MAEKTIRPALCVDMDGTVRFAKEGQFIHGPDDVAIFPDAEEVLWRYKNAGYLIFGVTNQGGIAHGHLTIDGYQAAMLRTFTLFASNPFNAVIAAFNDENGSISPFNKRSLARKPMYGMLAYLELRFAQEMGVIIDWDNSIIVGDRPEDEQMAAAAGVSFQWADSFFGRLRIEASGGPK